MIGTVDQAGHSQKSVGERASFKEYLKKEILQDVSDRSLENEPVSKSDVENKQCSDDGEEFLTLLSKSEKAQLQMLLQRVEILKSERNCLLQKGDEEQPLSQDRHSNRLEDKNVDKDEEKNEDESDCLPEDSFSMLIVSKPTSVPFLSALAVFVVQMATFLLLTLSTTNFENTKNPLSIPTNVSATVRGTQIIAIIFTVLTQDDFRNGMKQINEGYHREALNSNFSHTHFVQWVFSVTARCLEGSLSLLVTFLLIATSGTVIDLLLNFSAMEFVSQLDEIFFLLAQQGFIGSANAELAEKISSTTFPKRRHRCNIHPFVPLAIITMGMMVGWFLLYQKQASGAYLCSTIYVQFDDEFIPTLSSFSGLYDRTSGMSGLFEDHRVEYIDRMSGKARFAYCETLKAWTFTHDAKEGEDSSPDPCDWVIMSERTSTFDLVTVANSPWVGRDANQRETVLPYFFLSCFDCDQHNGSHGECGGRGTCSDAVCNCDSGWFGLRCEFSEPCSSLEIDERVNGFLGNRPFARTFTKIEYDGQDITMYNRPVYAHLYDSGDADIMLFTGRRWILTYSQMIDGIDALGTSRVSDDSLAKYLTSFHAFWSKFSIAFISDPMDVFTPSDSESPVAVKWYQAEVQDFGGLTFIDRSASPSEVSLICSTCNNSTNKCLYGGICLNDGSCSCIRGAVGTLCQVPPVGDGKCDPFFNIPSFEYDGGDCCASTCINGEYTCGKDRTGLVDIGFFQCEMPQNMVQDSGGKISDGEFSRLGYTVAMSREGNTIAVGEPAKDMVTVWDRDGSQWAQRGLPLQGPPRSEFGRVVSLSPGIQGALSNPYSRPEFTLVVGSGDGIPRVYYCESKGCLPKGEDNTVKGFSGNILVGASDLDFVVVAGLQEFSYVIDLYSPNIEGLWEARNETLRLPEHVDGFPTPFSMALSNARVPVIVLGTYSVRWSGISADVLPFDFSYSVYEFGSMGWQTKGNILRLSHNDTDDDMTNYYLRPHGSIAVSEEGDFLAIGMADLGMKPGVTVYELKDENWIQRGRTIAALDIKCMEGWSVAMSDDGNTIVVGTGQHVTEGNINCPVQVYEWDGNDWSAAEGVQIQGGTESAVAINGVGTRIAVGLPFDEVRMTGSVEVYDIIPSGCSADEHHIRIFGTVDDDPSSLSWSLKTNENVIVERLFTVDYPKSTSYYDEACVSFIEDCITFTIHNGRGRLNDQGLYSIVVDGEIYETGSITGHSDSVQLGNCDVCSSGLDRLDILLIDRDGSKYSLTDSSNSTLATHNFRPKSNAERFMDTSSVCIDTGSDCYTFRFTHTPDPPSAYIRETFIGLYVNSEEIVYESSHGGEKVHYIGNCMSTKDDGIRA